MNQPRPLALLVLLAACSAEQEREGVAVGNPTKGVTDHQLAARVAPSPEADAGAGQLPVHRLTLDACDGGASTVLEDTALPVVDGAPVDVPSGAWCGLTAELSGPLEVSGTSRSGGTFQLTLDLGDLVLVADEPFSTDRTDLLLVLGRQTWLEGLGLGAGAGSDVAVVPGTPEHDRIVTHLRRHTVLVADADADREHDGGEDVVADTRGVVDTGDASEQGGNGNGNANGNGRPRGLLPDGAPWPALSP